MKWQTSILQLFSIPTPLFGFSGMDTDGESGLTSDKAIEHLKRLSRSRPADFWGPRAKSSLHWHNAGHSAWLSQTNDGWEGWDDASGAPCSFSIDWQPWGALLDNVSGNGSNPMDVTLTVFFLTLLCALVVTGRLAFRAMVRRRSHKRSFQ